MKVFDWTSESGVNYAVVVDSIKALTTKYTAPNTGDEPGTAVNNYVAIDTDDGRYVAFTDQDGYAWLQVPKNKVDKAATYLVITTSINRFEDKVYEADKEIRLAATPI
jgi:translation elongation factor P/translation initiation factor 5A